MMKEKIVRRGVISGMPSNPYFCVVFDKNGKIKDGSATIGMNNEAIYSHRWLVACSRALEKLLKALPDQKAVDLYNFVREEELKKEFEESKNSVHSSESKRSKIGYVYILKSAHLFKIGRTGYPVSRFKTYRTENPFGISKIIMKQVSDCEKLETLLLKKFAKKQERGEWFRLSNEDVKEAKKIIQSFS